MKNIDIIEMINLYKAAGASAECILLKIESSIVSEENVEVLIKEKMDQMKDKDMFALADKQSAAFEKNKTAIYKDMISKSCEIHIQKGCAEMVKYIEGNYDVIPGDDVINKYI